MGLFKRIERNANARKYQKTIEQSSGLKKIHLMVRNHGVDFTFMFSHAQGGSKLVFMLVNVVTTENLFADIFFTTLNDSIVRAGGSTDEMFSNLANELYRDYNKQKMIASRLYGVAFAIILHKAADISRKAINKTGVDKFIDSSGLNEGFKDSIKESFFAGRGAVTEGLSPKFPAFRRCSAKAAGRGL